MAQTLQMEMNSTAQNAQARTKSRTQNLPSEGVKENSEFQLETSPAVAIPLAVGDRVRHTRFLNTNGPSGTYILEISDAKALCQYIDFFGKTRQVWFTLRDLIQEN